MTNTTDPETVLRLACERMMVGDPNRGWPPQGPDVATVGRALTAAGMLDEDAVMAVVDEYALAMSLRGRPGFRFMVGVPDEQCEDLSVQRVAVTESDIDTDERHLHVSKIVFTPDETRIRASGTQHGRTPAVSSRPGWAGYVLMHHRVDPGTLSLKDDKGTTATASPQSYGGSDRTWDATFHSDPPLAPDTAWIEIEGTRIDLPRRRPHAEVRIEPLETRNTINEALQIEITSGLQGQATLEDFIRALESVGAVTGDDPDVAEARKVAAAIERGTGARDVGPPWDAVFRRSGKSDGPVGQMPIGAAVASLAGHSIRFDSLTSQREGFSVDVAVSPGTMMFHHFPGFQLRGSPISWWAEDDRLNSYLGVANSQGGHGSEAEGTIVFITPLDPQARQLRLLPTARHERAVITVALDHLRLEP